MKRSIKSLLLLLALVLFAGGYLLLGTMNTAGQVDEESGAFALTAKTAQDLEGLKWTRDEVDYHFTTNGSAWVRADQEGFPVDQDALQALADRLLDIVAGRKLENVTDLAAYGLAEPAFTVTALWTDGTSTTYAMGDATPFNDGFYLSTGQDGVAYTVSTSLTSMFSADMNDLAQMEDFPTAENVTRLTAGSVLDARYQEASSTVNADQHWYDSNGNALDGVEDLVSDVRTLDWKALVNPCATQEELTFLQLDDASAIAVTLYDGETEAVRFLVGSADENGDFHARLPGSGMVYTLAADSIGALLEASDETLLSTALVETDYEQLSEAVFTTAGRTYTLTPMPAAETDEASAEEASEETPEDPGEDLWNALTAITASDFAQAEPGAQLLTVTLTTTEGVTAQVTFSEYDASNYIASMDSRRLLVSADKVDQLIRAVKTAE